MVKFDFSYIELLSEEEVLNKVESFERRGYYYLQDWNEGSIHVPERVKMPSGKTKDREELFASFDELRIGDKEQIESLKALEYLALINSEAVGDARYKYESFLNEQDDEETTKRYSKS